MHVRNRAHAALVVLALALTGCGGGAGRSAAVPASPQSGGATPTSGSGTGTAQFSLTIPASVGTAAAKRSPAYISAATQSIVVAATGSSSTASATVNVSSSSCVAGPSGTTCTLTVQAAVGNDTFTVTTYDAQNGTGNVLASGTVTATIVAYQTNVVPLTLGGTIASLAIVFSNAYLPVLDGGTSQATIVAKDAGGNQIVGTFTSPIALSATSGLTLSAASVADSSHNVVTVTYDGKSKTALPVSAASGSVSVQASVIPTTHVRIYTGGTPATSGSSEFQVVKGPDGALYFGDLGATTVSGNLIAATGPGAIGRFDPTTGSIVEVSIAGTNPAGLTFVGNDLYIAELGSGSIGKITNAGAGGFSAANYSQVLLPNHPPTGTLSIGTHYDGPRWIVYVASLHSLFITCNTSAKVAQLDVNQWNTGGAVTYVSVPLHQSNPNYYGERPLTATLGADGYLYIAEYDFNTGNINIGKLLPGAATMTDIPVTVGLTPYDTLTRFIALGADGRLYLTEITDTVNPGPIITYNGSVFGTLPGLARTVNAPDTIAPGTGTTLVYSNLTSGSGVGVYDTAANVSQIFPVDGNTDSASNIYTQVVADGGGGDYYFTVANTAATPYSDVEIGRLSLAQGWQLLPEKPTQIDGTAGSFGIIGIGEAATSHDTVTVTTTTPTICSVNAASGYTGTYVVLGLSAGSCTVSAVDQTGRTVTKSIPVTTNSLTITAKKRSSM